MCNNPSRHHRGFTLIEMIIAIVILTVGLAGVLLAFNTNVTGSANAVVTKQLVSIAEETMEEVLLRPYPAPLGVAAGGPAIACGVAASRALFNDVGDYNGYRTTGICDIDGNALPGLANYNLQIAVAPVAWQGINNTLRVTVTVTNGNFQFVLDGWRTP